MNEKYLNELVQNNSNLIPLTSDSAPKFVLEVNTFFSKSKKGIDLGDIVYFRNVVDLYWTLIDSERPVPWRYEGRISIDGAETESYPNTNASNGVLVYYRHVDDIHQLKHKIRIHFIGKGVKAGYAFVPDVELYLHEEVSNDKVGIRVLNHLLIPPAIVSSSWFQK